MSRPGRKPQSAAVKTAKGNPGRRPVGKDPESANSDNGAAVPPPAWLKGDGLMVWKRLAPRLFGIKILTLVDAETFARYCHNFGRWLKLQKAIDKEGAYYGTETGFSRPHPAMVIVLRLEPILERAEDRFGLNPSERQRLFAARAQHGAAGDLFSPAPAEENKKAPVKSEIDLAKTSAIGVLN